jgi:SAM-dependent methyltransferase
MVSLSRWHSAQEYELGYWTAHAERIAAGAEGQLGWYRWRAEQLENRLRRLELGHVVGPMSRIVEVGSGPIGVTTYLTGLERVAVDPLADAYGRSDVLTALRDPAVEYRTGLGEKLPCKTGIYDLAIIENCIDHVHDVTGVMSELVRALKPGGVLYLTVNNRTRWGYGVHRVLSRLRIDRGHPHTFTPPRTERLIERSGFRIVDVEIGSYAKAKQEDRSSPERKARIKAAIGISEFVVSLIAIKK